MSNNKFIIYILVFPNNKRYIGQSCNIEQRMSSYKNLHCDRQPKVYNAIKKYGWENVKKIFIENVSNINLSNYLEELYVQIYQTQDIRFGYNCTSGGKSRLLTEEEKIKRRVPRPHIRGKNNKMYGKKRPEHSRMMKGRPSPLKGSKRPDLSLKLKGRKISQNQRKKHSDLMSGEGNPMYGKKHNQSSLDKMSIRSKSTNALAKYYGCYDENISKIRGLKKLKIVSNSGATSWFEYLQWVSVY